MVASKMRTFQIFQVVHWDKLEIGYSCLGGGGSVLLEEDQKSQILLSCFKIDFVSLAPNQTKSF